MIKILETVVIYILSFILFLSLQNILAFKLTYWKLCEHTTNEVFLFVFVFSFCSVYNQNDEF